jgi:hypothetical protein
MASDEPVKPANGLACTHWVHCENGIITRSPDLECVGGCSEGCCDYYKCKVCGKSITIEYDG